MVAVERNRMSASFPLGDIVATPAALEACRHDDLQMLMGRHARGDWGDVCEADRRMNDAALKVGARLLSCYVLMGGDSKIWIITKADRSATTVLLNSGSSPPNRPRAASANCPSTSTCRSRDSA